MKTLENHTKKNFIVLGGCHVIGYGIQGRPSFIEIVEKTFNLKCVLKKPYFQIKHIDKIKDLLEQFQPDIMFLQLGNYEFNATLKDISPLLNKIRKKSYISTSNKEIENNVNRNSSIYKRSLSTVYFTFSSFVKLALMPIIWRNEKKKNMSALDDLKIIIQENQDKTFVIISPLPCLHVGVYARKKAVSIFRDFDCLPNVVFLNSFINFPIKKEMFLERYHLNVKGHEHLGKLLCEKLKQENIEN